VSDIYYGFILFPIIFMMSLSFIFQSEVEELTYQTWRLGCPFPIYNGNVTVNDVNPPSIDYDISYYESTTDFSGSFFDCSRDIVTRNPTLSVASRAYDENLFDVIPIGSIGYVYDWLGILGQKIDAFFQSAYLFLSAPAQITALSFFAYIYIVLIVLVAFGTFMVIRGS
jgi:hypothetical protein